MHKDVEENKKMQLNYQVVIPTFIEKEMYSPNPTFGKGGTLLQHY